MLCKILIENIVEIVSAFISTLTLIALIATYIDNIMNHRPDLSAKLERVDDTSKIDENDKNVIEEEIYRKERRRKYSTFTIGNKKYLYINCCSLGAENKNIVLNLNFLNLKIFDTKSLSEIKFIRGYGLRTHSTNFADQCDEIMKFDVEFTEMNVNVLEIPIAYAYELGGTRADDEGKFPFHEFAFLLRSRVKKNSKKYLHSLIIKTTKDNKDLIAIIFGGRKMFDEYVKNAKCAINNKSKNKTSKQKLKVYKCVKPKEKIKD